MYDLDFVNGVLDRVRLGEKKEDILKDTEISRRALYLWINGKTPHKRLFSTEKKYYQNYYQKNKEKIRRQGYIQRLGFDGNIIFERDKHQCQSCGKTKKLEIHHIDGDNTNNAYDNLITVCKGCHTSLNYMLNQPTLTMLFIKHEEGKAKSKLKLDCPLCDKKYKYFIAFAKHMLNEHKWTVENSLEYFSEHRS